MGIEVEWVGELHSVQDRSVLRTNKSAASIGGVNVHPNVLTSANGSQLLEFVVRADARRAQSRDYVEGNQACGAVLFQLLLQSLAAHTKLIICFEFFASYWSEESGSLNTWMCLLFKWNCNNEFKQEFLQPFISCPSY